MGGVWNTKHRYTGNATLRDNILFYA